MEYRSPQNSAIEIGAMVRFRTRLPPRGDCPYTTTGDCPYANTVCLRGLRNQTESSLINVWKLEKWRKLWLILL